MSASTFKPIPDFDPGKMVFSLVVPNSQLEPSRIPVPLVTTFNELKSAPYDFSIARELEGDGYGDYVYSHFDNAQGGVELFFIKPRDASALTTPVAAHTYVTTDIYPWPNVIKLLYAMEDRTQPIDIEVNGRVEQIPRLFLRMLKIKGGNFPSLVTVEHFVSHEAFPESFFKTNIPMPGHIFTQIRNLTIDEFALHGELELPEIQSQATKLQNFGSKNISFDPFATRTLPATNHVDWRTHVYEETVRRVNGLHVCERRTVKPPRGKRNLDLIGI